MVQCEVLYQGFFCKNPEYGKYSFNRNEINMEPVASGRMERRHRPNKIKGF